MPEATDHERDEETLERALSFLSEHFEAVTIFVSRFTPGDDGGTVSAWRGRGNWHARHGQIREWLVKRDAEARIEAAREVEDEEE